MDQKALSAVCLQDLVSFRSRVPLVKVSVSGEGFSSEGEM